MPPRSSCRSAIHVRVLIAALALVAGYWPSATALLNDNTIKGAATNHLFSESFGDSIDTLSGQLYFKVPIGPSLAVSPALSYQVNLVYTSKVWRYNPRLTVDAFSIDGRAQAGVGFYLQMGRIYWKWSDPYCDISGADTRKLVVQFGDGTEHDISDSVSTDLSFIRRESILDPNGMPAYRLTTPDGVVYTMDHWVGDPHADPNSWPWNWCQVDGRGQDPRSSDYRGWYVTSITDPTSNKAIGLEYETAPGMQHLIKRIYEPATGREIVFTNAICDAAAGLPCEAGVVCDPNSTTECDPGNGRQGVGFVTRVDVPSFNKSARDANAATYTFHYAMETTTNAIVKPPLDPPDPSYDITLPGEIFLKRIEMPEGYEVTYDYEDPNLGQVGLITQRTTPSGAQIRYVYGRYSHSVDPANILLNPGASSFCQSLTCETTVIYEIENDTGFRFPLYSLECSNIDPNCQTPAPAIVNIPATTGVAVKTVRWNPGITSTFSETPAVEQDVWTWNRTFTYDPTSSYPLSNPYKVIETDPFGNEKVHYFGTSLAVADPNDIPDQTHLTDWQDGLLLKTEDWLGAQGTLVRSTTYDYEDDTIRDPQTGELLQHTLSNRRVQAITKLSLEGGPRGTRVVMGYWDGYGHYREKYEYGYGGVLYRATYTGYNCFDDAKDPNNGACRLRPGHAANWILNTYNQQVVVDASYTAVRESNFEFGQNDGLMRRRIDRIQPSLWGHGNDPGSLSPGDVMTTWIYYGDADCDASNGCASDPYGAQQGFLAVKRVESGAPYSPLEPLHRESYTYEAGYYPATTRPGTMSWLSQDVDRDVNTGLVTQSRDPSGIVTVFDYDELGRLTRLTPGGAGSGEAPVQITYPDLFTAYVRQVSAQDPNQDLSTRYSFDQLFRMRKEEKWMEDGRVVARLHSHDVLGRETFVSEWGSDSVGTTYDYSYPATGSDPGATDPLDRVHVTTTADGSQTTVQYLGATTMVTVDNLGEDPSNPFDATTAYERDAFGRLVTVVAPQNLDPQITTSVYSPSANAEYEYDILGNLAKVTLRDPLDVNAPPQHRFFTYDALGRLTSSTQPENGSETFPEYSATGKVLEKIDPAGNEHEYSYDEAERLRSEQVAAPGESAARLMKVMDYDLCGTGGNQSCEGKLGAAKSFRYIDGVTEESRSTFEYNGLNGRFSRATSFYPGADPGTGLEYSVTYDDLGLVRSATYPYHSELGGTATEVDYKYSNGLLTAIERADQEPLIPEIKYNDAGGLSWIATAGQTATEIVPDVMNRPSQILIGFTGTLGGGEGDPNGSGGGGGSCQDPHCLPGIGGNYASLGAFQASPGRFVGQASPFTVTYHDTGAYKYDGQGNIVKMGPEKFLYDATGRLRSALLQHPDGDFFARSYDYDAFGNLLNLSISNPGSTESPLVSRHFDVDHESNRMLTQTSVIQGEEANAVPLGAQYDTNGNLSSDGQQQYQFDELDQLVRLTRDGATIADYLYDYSGNRIIKRHWPSDTETYYFRGPDGQLLSEFRKRISDTSGELPVWVKDYVYAGDRLVAAVQDPAPATPGPIATEASGPSDPNGPAITAMVRLTITPGSDPDVATYRVYKSSPGGPTEQHDVPAGSGEAPVVFQDDEPAVQEGIPYTYSVSAIDNALNESTRTRDYVVTPGDDTPPPPPGSPTLVPGDDAITLTWDDPDQPQDHYGYYVYRRHLTDPDPNYYRLSTSPVPSQVFTDIGLVNGTAYSYYVTAVDTAGNESTPDPNATVNATPVDLIPPGTPRDLQAVAHVSSVDLWWAANPEPDVVAYILKSSTEPIPDSSSCQYGTTIPSTTRTASVVFPPSTETYHRICAVDDDGNYSPLSPQIEVRTRNDNVYPPHPSNLRFDSCTAGNDYSVYDAAICLLPGSVYDISTSVVPDLEESPFSHLNYLELKVTPTDVQYTDGFQLYRRRTGNDPWEKVSTPVKYSDTLDPIPPWPWSYDWRNSSAYLRTYALFDLDTETFCGTPYEYAVASLGDVNDPTSEGEIVPVDPNSGPIVAPPPAVENLRIEGDPTLPSDLFYDPMPDPVPPVTVRWDPYKGACRPDYKGVHVYRRWDPTFDPTRTWGIHELTNGPTKYNSWRIPPDLVETCSEYRFFAQAEFVGGETSKYSNWVCSRLCPNHGTCNNVVGDTSDNCDGRNEECPGLTWLPGWDPSQSRPAGAWPSPPAWYPYVGSWNEMHLGISSLADVRRVRVYKEVTEGSSSTTTLVSESDMIWTFVYAPAGWSRGDTTWFSLEANPITECGPGVAYRFSYVDLMGNESPMSDPVELPQPLTFPSPMTVVADGSNNVTELEWKPVVNCGGNSLVGYEVYRIDIPNNAPCEIPAGSTPELLTHVPITGTTFFDYDPPGKNGNVILYYVQAVGAPGDPNARSAINGPVCTSANSASLERSPELGPEEVWKVAEGIAGNSPSQDGGEPGKGTTSPVARPWRTSPERMVGQTAGAKEVVFFHTDHLGTPLVVTDSQGFVLSKHKYSPFGEELAPVGANTQTRRFTSHERDEETGLDYMLARYYTSQAGRFLSVDPVIGKGALQTPTLWNRYAYVMDSPLRYVDPDGQLLQFSACVANVSSEACAAQYNLYLSTFGKQSKEAAKYLELGKDGTVRFKNTTGQEFAKTFGMIGRASNYLISNRAAVFTIAFGSVSEGAKFDDTKGGGGTITLDLSQFPRTLVGVSVSSTEALVHEMGHAISTLIPGYAERLNLRAGTSFITKMTPRNEAYATVFENAWRRLVAGETTIRSGYVVAGDVRDLGDVSLFP